MTNDFLLENANQRLAPDRDSTRREIEAWTRDDQGQAREHVERCGRARHVPERARDATRRDATRRARRDETTRGRIDTSRRERARLTGNDRRNAS